MRRRRFRAAIASIGLHLLFVIIAALLFSGQRELNKDAFEATFVTLNPARTAVEIRPTRRTVSAHTPLLSETSTETRIPTQASRRGEVTSPLQRNQTDVVQPVPPLDVETDILNPTELSVAPTLPNSRQFRGGLVKPESSLTDNRLLKTDNYPTRRRGTNTSKTDSQNFWMAPYPQVAWEMGSILRFAIL